MSWTKPTAAGAWQRDFGNRLRACREAAGLSQMKVALAADLDPTYISAVEQGRRNLGLVNINVLAAVLGVSPREFFPTEPSQPIQAVRTAE